MAERIPGPLAVLAAATLALVAGAAGGQPLPVPLPTSTGCLEAPSGDCNRDWMAVLDGSGLIRNRPISQLVLPGSHDAAMVTDVEGAGYSCQFGICESAVTQDRNVYHQLERGSRYLDLRFAWNCHPKVQDWTSYHNIWFTDYRMRDILFDGGRGVLAFLARNPREIVILDVRTYDGDPSGAQTLCDPLVGHFRREFDAICRRFVDENWGKFIRPTDIRRAAYLREPERNGVHPLNDAAAPVREGMSVWDPGGVSTVLSLREGDRYQNPGRFAPTSTVGDIWDLPGGPQMIVFWPACADAYRRLTGRSAPFEGWTQKTSAPPEPPGTVLPTTINADLLGYYPHWCYWEFMLGRIEEAVRKRLKGAGRKDQTERAFGLYNVSVATTYTTIAADQGGPCAVAPRPGLAEQEWLLDELRDRYAADDRGNHLQANLNILNGDFLEDSDLPEVAIEMNQIAVRDLSISLTSGRLPDGTTSVRLDCGTGAVSGQLLRVPEPYVRIESAPGRYGPFLPLLVPAPPDGRRVLARPQYAGIPPVAIDGGGRAEILVDPALPLLVSGLEASTAGFPGSEFPGTPVFAFTGKRTETFIGTCVNSRGVALRDTLTVQVPDRDPPTITVEACPFTPGCPVPYVAGTWSADPVVLTPHCDDDSRGVICSDPIVRNSDGVYPSHAFTATDVEGRTATVDFGEVRIDATPPSVRVELVSGGRTYFPGNWTRFPVQATPVCSDSASGVADCDPPRSLEAEGVSSASFAGRDVAGNVAIATVADIWIDRTPPTIGVLAETRSGPYATGSWVAEPVTVRFTCEDLPAGSASGLAVCPDPIPISDGDLSVAGEARDVAGNTARASVRVRVDTRPPSLEARMRSGGAPYTPGTWANQPVTVDFPCRDEGVGLEGGCPAPVTFASSGADQGVTVSVRDLLGHEAVLAVDGIFVDRIPPTVTLEGAGEYGILDLVSIRCSAADGESGIAHSACADATRPAWELGVGTTTFTASATDRAGNVGTATASVRVVATHRDLCVLATRFNDGSRGKARALCNRLRAAERAAARGRPDLHARRMTRFVRFVDLAVRRGWLTAAEGDVLSAAGRALAAASGA